MALAQTPDTSQVMALAKRYFRDSAEMPMQVSVTTTVRGKERHANVTMLFSGYGEGRFRARAKGRFADRGMLKESLSGELAAFASGALLLRKRDTARIEGDGHEVRIVDSGCPPLRLVSDSVLFPAREALCGTAVFETAPGVDGPTFSRFRLTSANVPARVKTADLGEVELRSFQVEEEFQSLKLKGDARPVLLPKTVRIKATTDKGDIEIRNEYTPKN